ISRLMSKLRKMAEDALSSVNRRLVDAEDRERVRIAKELDDDLGQRCALLAVNFEQLGRDVPSSTVEIRTTMNELLEQIKHLSIDVNTLAHDLHSPKLEYLGIAKTMR